MKNETIEKIDSELAEKTIRNTGADLNACYQCSKCSNGCPVTFAMDYYPHRLVRMVQLGLKNEVLASRTIWVCASCETCHTRCPQGIDIPKIMDYFKQQALYVQKKNGFEVPEHTIADFHQTFLNNIRWFGRINETVMMAEYQVKSLGRNSENPAQALETLKQNLRLGVEMLKRGRLNLVPVPKNVNQIKPYFKRNR